MEKKWHRPEHRKGRQLKTITVKVEPAVADALTAYAKAEGVSQGRILATLLSKDVGFRAQAKLLARSR